MLSLAIHNPPRRTRKARKARRKARRSAPTAKQRANWARFAKMARAKAAGRKRRTRRSSTNRTRQNRVVFASTRRATTVPKSRRKSRRASRRGRRGGGNVARRGFTAKEMPIAIAGTLAGLVIGNKVPDMLPASLVAGNNYKRIGVKAALAVAVHLLGRSMKAQRFTTPIVAGIGANAAYDLLKQFAPQLASNALNGYDDPDSMGEMFAPQLQGDGMGEMFEPSAVSLRSA